MWELTRNAEVIPLYPVAKSLLAVLRDCLVDRAKPALISFRGDWHRLWELTRYAEVIPLYPAAKSLLAVLRDCLLDRALPALYCPLLTAPCLPAPISESPRSVFFVGSPQGLPAFSS